MSWACDRKVAAQRSVGDTSRRGAADALGVPAVEGIAITQAIEKIVYLLKDLDPAIPADAFKISFPTEPSKTPPIPRSERGRSHATERGRCKIYSQFRLTYSSVTSDCSTYWESS